MKAFTLVALASVLSLVSARDVVLQHRALWKRATNLATFTGDLGGIAVTPITCSGDATRQFEVNGDTFVGFGAAADRSCSIQHNACADAANSGGAFSVSDCDTQNTQCVAEQSAQSPSCTGASAAAANTTAASTAATTSTCSSAKRRKNKQRKH